jgi:hypothetical protein
MTLYLVDFFISSIQLLWHCLIMPFMYLFALTFSASAFRYLSGAPELCVKVSVSCSLLDLFFVLRADGC